MSSSEKKKMKEGEQKDADKQPEDMEEASLRMLNARRMLELKRRAALASMKEEQQPSGAKKEPKQLSDREVLLKALVDRGDEVLNAAESSYPDEMRLLIPKLADLIREEKLSSISGGELLHLLRTIGLRVSVATSISVEEHGRFVSLSDKLKQEREKGAS